MTRSIPFSNRPPAPWRMALLLVALVSTQAANAQQTYRDVFDTASYTLSDGSVNWTGQSWAETNDDNDPGNTSGLIYITNGEVRFQVDDKDIWAYLERQADIAGATSATLTFTWRVEGNLEPGDRVRFEVSDDGGASWRILDELFGNGGGLPDNGGSGSESYDITADASLNTRIRFSQTDFRSNDEVFFLDNVEISFVANSPPVAEDDAASTDNNVPVVIDVLGNDTDPDGNLTTPAKSMTGTNATLAANGDALFIPFTPENSGTLGDPRPDAQGVGLAQDTATLTDDDTSVGSVSYVYTFDNGSPFLPAYYFDAATGELVLTLDDIDFKPTIFPDIFGSGLDLTFSETLALTFLPDPTDTPTGVDLLLDDTNYGTYRTDGFGETNNQVVEYRLHVQNDLGADANDFADLNADGDFALYVTFSTILVTTDLDPGATNSVTVSNSAESMTDAFVAEGTCYALPSVTAAPANGSTSVDPLTGAITYTPDPGFTGTDTFTYTLCDADGACDTALVTVIVDPLIDLALTKVVDEPAPVQNTVVVYTFYLTNDGPGDATGVTMTDVLPDSLSFVSALPSRGTYTANVWTLGTLATGATDSLQITATVLGATDPITNTAEVSTADQPDADSTPGNNAPAEDDQDSVTITPSGSSGSGDGGLESDGTLAGKLARTLFSRRLRTAVAVELNQVAPPPRFDRSALAAAKSDNGTFELLLALIPDTGPQQSQPLEVSPTDLLPVTNAVDVLAVNYIRQDERRLAAFFGTTTEGARYEHTKVICDRLRGATLAAIERVEIAGQPFILSELHQDQGALDYAVSLVVYPQADGFVVDSRFRLDEYEALPPTQEVLNLQVWSVSRAYTVDLVARILATLRARGPVVFRNTHDDPPALPQVYVRAGHYRQGRLLLELYNAAAIPAITLTGGTLARTEGGDRFFFEQRIPVPAAPPNTEPVVEIAVDVGPVFDAAFFVEADTLAGKDQLYLADGAWSYAYDGDGAAVSRFDVASEQAALPAAGQWKVERNATLQGEVRTWATLFRYLQSNGRPMDLQAYQYVEFTAWGTGQVRMLAEKAGITTSDHYGALFKLTDAPQRHRIWFDDLRRGDGQGGFTAEDLVLLSFYVLGPQGRTHPFALHVDDLRFGGGPGDVLAEIPDKYALAQNYPNPFNPETTIGFSLPEDGPVRLVVYDLLGRVITTLVDASYTAGRHTVRFDARALASGVYLYRLEAAGHQITQTMVLMR